METTAIIRARIRAISAPTEGPDKFAILTWNCKKLVGYASKLMALDGRGPSLCPAKIGKGEFKMLQKEIEGKVEFFTN